MYSKHVPNVLVGWGIIKPSFYLLPICPRGVGGYVKRGGRCLGVSRGYYKSLSFLAAIHGFSESKSVVEPDVFGSVLVYLA